MAGCADQQLMLNGLLDGELDAANTAAVEAHLTSCHDCRDDFARMQAVRDMLAGAGVRHAAPERLRARVASAIDDVALGRRGRLLPSWLAPGVAGALAASLAMLLIIPAGTERRVEDDAVAGHIRSLQVQHLTDVRTSNQHLIKPWFNGKIDFSPPVPELSPQGFPLAGGRLDYVGGRTVAAIVYRRRLHTINLFVWPAGGAAERTVQRDGYAVAEWSSGGLRYVAVSDIAPAEMATFKQAFVGAAG
jgi:anti-sigma factor RsiW